MEEVPGGGMPRPKPGADEARLMSLIEHAPAYFYLADPVDSSTLYRSAQAESMLGYTLAEWAENPDLWLQILHPEDRDRVLAEFLEAARTDQPFRSEYRLRTKDGRVRWLRDHAVLVKDPSGPGRIVQGVVLDITEQVEADRAAELARAESTAKSRFIDSVFEHAPLGVARVDTAMKIIDANPRLRAILTDGARDMVGMSVADFLEPAELEKVVERFRPLFQGKVETAESESEASPLSGSKVWVHWTAANIRRPDGTVDYFLVMFEDVSAKHAAQAEVIASHAELDRLNKLKSEFVSIVSHEFRTALTGIQGFSEILRDEADLGTAEVQEFAGDINKDALRLNRMITEMLDLDRMESGRVTLNLSEVDLNLIIQDAVTRCAATSDIHSFTTDLEADLPMIRADGDRVVQVITNLLSNAVKYSPDGGEVRVSSRIGSDGITIAVRDHGMGMPASFLTKVFERFERYESKETNDIIGTGLGLPIARQIVELHGGRIWVESTEGSGSEFSFLLPAG